MIFGDPLKFDKDELSAIKLLGEDNKKYTPYKYLVSKWASFFNLFIDNFKKMFNDISPLIDNIFQINAIENIKEIEIKKVDLIEIDDVFKREQYISTSNSDIKIEKLKKDKKEIVDTVLKVLYYKAKKVRLNKEKLLNLKNCLDTVKAKTILNNPVVWQT